MNKAIPELFFSSVLHDLIHSSLLVSGASDEELLIAGNVARENTGLLVDPAESASVRCPGDVHEIVLARRDEVLPGFGELQRQNTAFMGMDHVLFFVLSVDHLDLEVLTSDSDPRLSRTSSQGESLETQDEQENSGSINEPGC